MDLLTMFNELDSPVVFLRSMVRLDGGQLGLLPAAPLLRRRRRRLRLLVGHELFGAAALALDVLGRHVDVPLGRAQGIEQFKAILRELAVELHETRTIFTQPLAKQ